MPYLREIAQSGIDVELLTFEPGWPFSWTKEDTVLWRDQLSSTGIVWHAMAYHKRPSLPATLFDILAGAFKAVELSRRRGMNVYHARGYVPAVMGALSKSITGAKLIFDIRGFMPEEYVDAGVWTENGLIFRLAKAAERWLLRKADGFVVLTEKAKEILFPGSLDRDSEGRPIEVIPCCVDSGRFSPAETYFKLQRKRDLGLEGRFVIAYVGALGGGI
ncbi:MAG: glycosyltransferase [Acidobacteria bacterium]|nr:glycosyltransferase [Acidobacteriota bacterium]